MMKWQVSSPKKKCTLTGEAFVTGQRVESTVRQNTEGALERVDACVEALAAAQNGAPAHATQSAETAQNAQQAEAGTLLLNSPALARWQWTFEGSETLTPAQQRAQKKAELEAVFLSLVAGGEAPEAPDVAQPDVAEPAATEADATEGASDADAALATAANMAASRAGLTYILALWLERAKVLRLDRSKPSGYKHILTDTTYIVPSPELNPEALEALFEQLQVLFEA